MTVPPSSPSTSTSLRPYEKRHRASKQQYLDHLPTTEKLQAQLKRDAEVLAVENGWDPVTIQGVNTWIRDKSCIFRFLKRNSYDERKAYNTLHTALVNRATQSLHQPLPTVPPYSSSSLFYILPLPHFTDRLGRPIVILTAKEVKRDSHGSMHDLSQWIWWGAEMLRRTLRDHWVNGRWNDGKPRGEGGEGCVLIIDAGGSSYRNLEVELVPTFNLIGSKNFPGMIESAFVINAGWVQRSLWSILRPILPRPAVERISLVDKHKDMSEVFDLDRLPESFGGRHPWKFSPENNPILGHYQSHALSSESEELEPETDNGSSSESGTRPGTGTGSNGMVDTDEDETAQSHSQSGSFPSTAQVFYTAGNNTPVSSRTSTGSHRGGDKTIFMTRMRGEAASASGSGSGSDLAALNDPSAGFSTNAETTYPHDHDSTPLSDPTHSSQSHSQPHIQPQSRNRSRSSSVHTRASSSSNIFPSALERVRSLADFHLYLSPSRLAQIDGLSDSSSLSGSDDGIPSPLELPPPRRTLQPAILNQSFSAIPQAQPISIPTPDEPQHAKSRPCLRTLPSGEQGGTSKGNVRSYSDNLMRHHAQGLGRLDSDAVLARTRANPPPVIQTAPSAQHSPPPYSTKLPVSDGKPSSDQPFRDQPQNQEHPQPISAFSRSSNPYYGYPAVRIPSTIPGESAIVVPRYHRRRKRDLLRTLLFLFLLRLQTWRFNVERLLGLNTLLPLIPPLRAGPVGSDAHDPSEGLLEEARASRAGVKGRGDDSSTSNGNGNWDGTVSKKHSRGLDGDWIWIGIVFVLIRGSLARLITVPLESLGLHTVRDLFGLHF